MNTDNKQTRENRILVIRFSLVFVLLSAVAAGLACARDASAQSGKLPEFEVATIKPNTKGGMMGLYTYPGGRIFCGFCSVQLMIVYAFDVRELQAVGGPKWMSSEAYDVAAVPPEDSPARSLKPGSISTPPSSEQRLMLQSLLMDRFGLKYHRETREGPVYWMVRTKKRFAATLAKDKDGVPFMTVATYHDGVGNGEMMGESTTMAYMARRLSDLLKLPVIDKTGVEGAFDFDVPAPEPANADPMNATLEGIKQLGLKLESRKGPVEYVVIDEVAKPTEN
jgi:uncharacterized protein (TIGR03435 family)